jgi:hypothetical protein
VGNHGGESGIASGKFRADERDSRGFNRELNGNDARLIGYLVSSGLRESHELVFSHRTNQSRTVTCRTTFTFGDNPGVIGDVAENKFVENESPSREKLIV